MFRSVERSSDVEPLSLCRFCLGCIIATRGHDFREGRGFDATTVLSITIGSNGDGARRSRIRNRGRLAFTV
jgi:hypothetical protein